MDITILHVEDDPTIAQFVTMAFKSFGFSGTILSADCVRDAVALLCKRAKACTPIDLVIVDMQLPDGTGLDVVREVRGNAFWRLTPVLVLSGEIKPGTVNEAYALGANCYLPKAATPILQSLRALYDCWVRTALLPQALQTDRVEGILAKAVNLRARTSEFFFRLAELETSGPEVRFWLERFLEAGNLSNIMALFRNRVAERDVPPGAIERMSAMQVRVEESLRTAEQRLLSGVPDTDTACRLALDVTEAVDEEAFAEWLGYLFPKTPAATAALKERACSCFISLGNFVLGRATHQELRQRGEELLWRAETLNCDTAPATPDSNLTA